MEPVFDGLRDAFAETDPGRELGPARGPVPATRSSCSMVGMYTPETFDAQTAALPDHFPVYLPERRVHGRTLALFRSITTMPPSAAYVTRRYQGSWWSLPSWRPSSHRVGTSG
jgi:hypothetical protein